ncbi:MAG: tetratricopeptide repeat protein [Planctomycetes bacterium]|nr:tetratricopeptide repeat protein [Planctomycetota bacterium]
MDIRRQFQAAIAAINHGKTEEGRALLEEIHRIRPDDADAAMALGRLALGERDFARALALYEPLVGRPGLGAQPETMVVHVLSLAGKHEEAVARSRAFLRSHPHDATLVAMVAAALASSHRFDEAEDLLRRRYEIQARADIAASLSSALLNLGRCDEAVALLKDALERFPGDVGCLAALASATNYLSSSREETYRRHMALGRLVEYALPVIDPLSYENSPDPERPLRVAVVSFDLRAHSVAYFAEAILRHHDRSRMSITVFSTTAQEDHVSDRLRPLASAWRTHLSGEPRLLARDIWSTKPDVVVELGGLSGGSALAALVPQVAPVQVTAIGYPSTTGFRTVQYRMVDSITDPPGDADKFSAEELVRLDPCFLCFTPRIVPEPRRSPAGAGGPVFGSFNKITKYSDACVRAWASVLQRVPGARLLLKSPPLDIASAREHLSARLAGAGAPPDRVELVGRQEGEGDHLSMYERIDIALDSFPYNGTTTTCEALVMGVPVVVLEGTTHAGRVGASLLSAAGFPELIAKTTGAYVEKALDLASGVEKLRQERAGRSRKMLSSVLCDGPAYATRWGESIRTLWRRWCERKRAQASPSARR